MANKAKRQEREAKELARALLYRPTKKIVREPKKKTVSELFGSMGLYSFYDKQIRPQETYKGSSYNLQRQREWLLKHLYVKYPTPRFFYRLFGRHAARPFGIYDRDYYGFEWFFCIAQGGSFQKMVKGIMTKKEVISFLDAPENCTVEQAFWYAKMHHRGLRIKMINSLLFEKNLFNMSPLNYENNGERYDAMMDFYVKYHDEMDKQTYDEVTDFIRHKMGNDQTFTLRGRTLNSVITLSNEWHTLMQTAKLGTKVEWTGEQRHIWYYEQEKDNIMWEIKELKSNHELITEGRKQKHCVGGYTSMCSIGTTHIYSLRRYYLHSLEEITKNRITIEKRNNQLVQVRGLMNRSPSDEENRVIRRWVTQMGYNYEPSKNRWF